MDITWVRTEHLVGWYGWAEMGLLIRCSLGRASLVLWQGTNSQPCPKPGPRHLGWSRKISATKTSLTLCPEALHALRLRTDSGGAASHARLCCTQLSLCTACRAMHSPQAVTVPAPTGAQGRGHWLWQQQIWSVHGGTEHTECIQHPWVPPSSSRESHGPWVLHHSTEQPSPAVPQDFAPCPYYKTVCDTVYHTVLLFLGTWLTLPKSSIKWLIVQNCRTLHFLAGQFAQTCVSDFLTDHKLLPTPPPLQGKAWFSEDQCGRTAPGFVEPDKQHTVDLNSPFYSRQTGFPSSNMLYRLVRDLVSKMSKYIVSQHPRCAWLVAQRVPSPSPWEVVCQGSPGCKQSSAHAQPNLSK